VFPGTAQSQTRTWAVVVGINDYIHFEDTGSGDLRGAEHDANIFKRALMEEWGVPEENILVLLSRDATRSAIQEAITEWLPRKVQEGDRVFFFFAGHGSQALDRDGDEEDGLDETLFPADGNPLSFDWDIRDDDLREWLSRLPTSDIIVILDSCHSGTATRAGVGYKQARSLPERPTLRSGDSPGLARAGRADGFGTSGIAVEFTAAASTQSAMDVGFLDADGNIEFYGGVFTTHMVDALSQVGDSATFEDLYRLTYHSVKAARFEQDPQLSGQLNRSLFGEADPQLPIEEGLAVTTVREHQLSVSGGRRSGLSVDQILESSDGSLVRITQLLPETSIGEVISGSVIIGTTLSPASVVIPDGLVRVVADSLSSPDRRRLDVALQSEDDLELLSLGDQSGDVLLQYSENRETVLLHGRDGGLRASFPRRDGAFPLAEVVNALMRELVLERLAGLNNGKPPFDVDLSILGEDTDFTAGETIQIRVLSEEDGYLTLIDLDSEGSLTVLYPNPWSGLEGGIEAGREVVIPDAAMGFELEITPPTGMGLIRAIVSKAPLDLPLNPAGLLQTRSGSGELGEQLQTALREASWSAQGIKIVPHETQTLSGSWASALVTYRVVAQEGQGG
jgi:hypothetical protein